MFGWLIRVVEGDLHFGFGGRGDGLTHKSNGDTLIKVIGQLRMGFLFVSHTEIISAGT